MIVKIESLIKDDNSVEIIQAKRAHLNTKVRPPSLTIDDKVLHIEQPYMLTMLSNDGTTLHEYRYIPTASTKPSTLQVKKDTPTAKPAFSYRSTVDVERSIVDKPTVERELLKLINVNWGDISLVFRDELIIDVDTIDHFVGQAITHRMAFNAEVVKALDLLIMALKDIVKGNRERKLVRDGEYFRDIRQLKTGYNLPSFIQLWPTSPFTLHLTKIINDTSDILVGVPAYRVDTAYMTERYTNQVDAFCQDGIWLYPQRLYQDPVAFQKEAKRIKAKHEEHVAASNEELMKTCYRLENTMEGLREALVVQ